MPQPADNLLKLAWAEFQVGRVAEALALGDQAIAAAPQQLDVLLLVGILNAQLGRVANADALLKKALSEDPRQFPALFWLSQVSQRLGNRMEALQYAIRAVEVSPQDPLAHERLAYCQMALFDHEAAETAFRYCVRLHPQRATFVGGLGLCLLGQGKVGEARQLLLLATELDPTSATSFLHLARLYTEEQETENALSAARKAMELRPDWEEAIQAVISALLQQGLNQDAAQLLDRLSANGVSSPRTLVFIGEVRQSLGDSAVAAKTFEMALERNPVESGAWYGLVRSRRLGKDDLPLVAKMEGALRSTLLEPDAKANLEYALGKASEDLCQYEKAMSHFDEANRLSRLLKFGTAPFNPRRTIANDTFDLSHFTRDFLVNHREAGSFDEQPIFVVGMMRSGTTLTEQILASHPEIGGAGELKYWIMNHHRAFDLDHSRLLPEMLKPLADDYCALLRTRVPGKRFVVDKMPENYSLLPLLYLGLPKARMIHIHREPVDTCLSIWSTPNKSRIDWAHEKAGIVFAYERYQKLISAWRKALPDGAMLEIQYEDLVTNPERVIRSMLDFLGLNWSEACLRPQERQSSVVTPSSWQVRQPFNTYSVGRWRRFEPWLGAFRQLLP